MHKLIDYVCGELEEIEKKTDKGKLSLQEIQYADVLAHLKKDLLTAEAMSSSESEDYRGSYRRGRDSMGRYASRDRGSYDYYSREGKDDLEEQLRNIERNAQDEETRRMVSDWMRQLKR